MNRAQLTDELILQKKESSDKTTEIITLKTSLHHWKTNSTVLLVILIIALSIIIKVGLGRLTEETKSRTLLQAQYEEVFTHFNRLSEEYNTLQSNSSLVYISKEDLLQDLIQHYPDVSTKTKIAILETIISESERYNMNPLILYSVIFVESSFRHWLEHDTATIDINNKKLKIKAVGLMGVVWEWWGTKLSAAGIAETRGDLFDPITNIKAGAFVYNELYHQEMHKSARYKDESALLRYFGGDFISYVQRIDAKISTFTRPNLYRKH